MIYPFVIAFILFLWLRTNIFTDVLKPVTRVWPSFLWLDKYKMFCAGGEIEYSLWLNVRKPGLLAQLLSCPLCLSFWINMAIYNIQGFGFKGVEQAFITLVSFCALDRLYKHGK